MKVQLGSDFETGRLLRAQIRLFCAFGTELNRYFEVRVHPVRQTCLVRAGIVTSLCPTQAHTEAQALDVSNLAEYVAGRSRWVEVAVVLGWGEGSSRYVPLRR